MQDKNTMLVDLADSICWGHIIVNIDCDSIIFRGLSIQEKMIAKHIYENAIRSAERRGLKSKAALFIEAKLLGLWNDDYEKQLSELDDERKSIQEDIVATKQKSKIEKLNRRLSFITQIISPFIELKHRLLEAPNIENYAASEKIKYIVAVAAMSFPSMVPIWGSIENMEQEDRIEFANSVVRAYCENITDRHSDALIREVARSGYWRIKWCAAKNGSGISSLFTNSACDLTNNQIRLIYWSQVYDSVYDSPDRPHDDVINDDAKLDKWIEEKTKEAEQSRKNNALTKKSTRENHRVANANEMICSVDGFYCDKCSCNKPNGYHEKKCLYGVFLYHGRDERQRKINEIQESNPAEIRLLLAREKAILEKHGTMEEQHLRKDPRTRILLGMGTKTVNNKGT